MNSNECIDVLRKAKIAAVVGNWNTEENGGDLYIEDIRFFDERNVDVSDRMEERLDSIKPKADDEDLDQEDIYVDDVSEMIGERMQGVIERIDPDCADEALDSWGHCKLDVSAGKITVEYNKASKAYRKTEHTVSFANDRDVPSTKLLQENAKGPEDQEEMHGIDLTAEEESAPQEPVCHCTNLLHGHDANCEYWRHQQAAGR